MPALSFCCFSLFRSRMLNVNLWVNETNTHAWILSPWASGEIRHWAPHLRSYEPEVLHVRFKFFFDHVQTSRNFLLPRIPFSPHFSRTLIFSNMWKCFFLLLSRSVFIERVESFLFLVSSRIILFALSFHLYTNIDFYTFGSCQIYRNTFTTILTFVPSFFILSTSPSSSPDSQ